MNSVSSREKILFAAIKVYAQKGRHGARMEEIAAAAGLNKAMVYYVFRNRDVLYHDVLQHIMMRMNEDNMSKLEADIQKNLPPDILLKNIIEHNFDTFVANENYVKVVLEAMSEGGDVFRNILIEMKSLHDSYKNRISECIVERGNREGVFRGINAEELWGNIMGMNIVYFLTKPIHDIFCADSDAPDFLEQRKKSIVDLVLYGVLSRK
jgi:TetR/AcrR family transcriptional regulator